MVGLALILFHPDRAERSCHDCQTYRYVEDRSLPEYGKVEMRGGFHKVTRDRGEFPPCASCPKIAKGDLPHPSSAQELSERNKQAYQHWQECRAVGKFPDDPIVRRNAAIIQRLHDEYSRKPIHDLIAIIPLLGMKRG